MLKIAINGFGRIGRNVLRALYENNYRDQVQIVALNDLAPIETNAHLLEFDTTHGRFDARVSYSEDAISVNDDQIPMLCQREPDKLPWAEMDVDIVFECTGFFRTRQAAALHLEAGAKKVLVSAPGKAKDGVDLDATIVYGVNHELLTQEHTLVSNASCTTNCLAHIAKAMNDAVGIEQGLANTVHAYTNTQNLLDAFHKDPRRARAAAHSMIPTTTGSAKAIGAVIPELDGKLDAVSVRVPTLNVSLLDFTFTAKQALSVSEIENIFSDYAKNRQGVFAVNERPLVSVDFNHRPESCVVDLSHTRVRDRMVKLMAWYDNEWGFSNRMLDTALAMAKA